MGGWTISKLEGGGHRVSRIDGNPGEEVLHGDFAPEIAVEEIVEAVPVRSPTGSSAPRARSH